MVKKLTVDKIWPHPTKWSKSVEEKEEKRKIVRKRKKLEKVTVWCLDRGNGDGYRLLQLPPSCKWTQISDDGSTNCLSYNMVSLPLLLVEKAGALKETFVFLTRSSLTFRSWDNLCKLLSLEICEAFLSNVHLFRPYFRETLVGLLPWFFRICFFFNFYSNGGGSWYQNSVKACLTIGGLVGRFWSPLKFPTFLPPSFKLSVGREELRNGHFHEDAETFGDRIRLSVILRNINQRDIRRDAFQDTHTLRPAKNWKKLKW